MFAGLLCANAAAAPTMTATLDRDSIAVGDAATLQLRIEGGNLQSGPDFSRAAESDHPIRGRRQPIHHRHGRQSAATILPIA